MTGRIPIASLVLAVALMNSARSAYAQKPAPNPQFQIVDQPDAQRTKSQLWSLLNRYPPSLKQVLALDPELLSNQAYLAPYPALVSFLNTHPEVARNPSFYVSEFLEHRNLRQADSAEMAIDMWRGVMGGIAGLLAFGMSMGIVAWLIRTVINYRRWNRLAKVQADVHTKILDRFTANDELLAYIQSNPGRRFLESSPILLDEGPRSVAAPMGRILWSAQIGLVLTTTGIGMRLVSLGLSDEMSLPIKVLGGFCIALGIGFVLSATISYMISRKLGLIEPAAPRHETPSE